MAKPSRIEFVLDVCKGCYQNDMAWNIQSAIEVGQFYDEIIKLNKEYVKKNGGPTKTKQKESTLTEEQTEWFNNIWAAFNLDEYGNELKTKKGGVTGALNAFTKKPITLYNDAVMAYKAARRHSMVDRPQVIKEGRTAPDFPLWYNDGRWITKTIDLGCSEFAKEEEKPKKDETQNEKEELEKSLVAFEKTYAMMSEGPAKKTQEELIRETKEKLNKLINSVKTN